MLRTGNLDSYHTNITPEVFRGFVISDSIELFVVINDLDAHVAWSFTALHEVSHLWLGAGGISDTSMETEIETFCKNIAGQILLPDDEILILAHVGDVPFDEEKQTISDFSGEHKVSGSMVAYRLFRENIISATDWEALKSSFHQDWKSSKAERKKKQSKVYSTWQPHGPFAPQALPRFLTTDHSDFRRTGSYGYFFPHRRRVTIPSPQDLPGSRSVCRCATSAPTCENLRNLRITRLVGLRRSLARGHACGSDCISLCSIRTREVTWHRSS